MYSKNVTIDFDGITKVYKYEVTECDYKGVTAYGISITRKDIKDEIIIKEVTDSVHLVTPDKSKIIPLLDKLYASVVSPIHLIDIVGEYVDIWVSEFDKIEKYQLS